MDQLSDCPSPAVLDSASELNRAFTSAEPFRHVVIDDFFNPDFCRALVEEFPGFDRKNALNENGEIGGKAVHERVVDIGPEFRQLDRIDAVSDTPADGENVKLQQRVFGLERRLAEMENSNSWRITAPLRAIRRVLGAD